MSGLPLGKLPPELLARLLRGFPRDPRVLVPAQPGVDAAAVEIGGRVLIVTADPITFPTGAVGWYAVHVNANDIAVMGGEPRWFLATVLLPEGTDEEAVDFIFRDLMGACTSLGVTLIGGHTEVAYGIQHPIIAGTMLGESPLGGVITSAGIRPDDRIIITGGIAIEGTSILASEARDPLLVAGFSDAFLERASGMLLDPGISVVEAARTLREAVTVHAMHDATEGGLATALREMAEASGVGMEVREDEIPVLTETWAICSTLDLDPLGLLASGCLIAAVAPQDADRAVAALQDAGIVAVAAGSASSEEGLWLTSNGRRRPLPTFARDELARWLESRRT